MVIESGLVSRLARRLTGSTGLLVLAALLLVAVTCACAVVAAGLLAPTPEPVLLAPLRWG